MCLLLYNLASNRLYHLSACLAMRHETVETRLTQRLCYLCPVSSPAEDGGHDALSSSPPNPPPAPRVPLPRSPPDPRHRGGAGCRAGEEAGHSVQLPH